METFLYGSLIGGRWRTRPTLGSGSFGSVYLCVNEFNENTRGAVKLKVLKEILKLPPNEREFFPDSMDHEEGPLLPMRIPYDFLVMSAAETGVEDLREAAGGRFSLATSIKLSIQLLRALRALHNANIVHNDIKIVNLLMGRKKEVPSGRGLAPNRLDQMIVVDFGLAEPYLLSNVGLTKSRQDDCESFFYVMVALFKGQLPWHYCSSQRENVRELKLSRRTGGLRSRAERNDALNNLLGGFPEAFVRVLKYIMRYISKFSSENSRALHSVNVMHNDIKIVNLLMGRKKELPSGRGLAPNRLDQLIVVDFGLAQPYLFLKFDMAFLFLRQSEKKFLLAPWLKR